MVTAVTVITITMILSIAIGTICIAKLFLRHSKQAENLKFSLGGAVTVLAFRNEDSDIVEYIKDREAFNQKYCFFVDLRRCDNNTISAKFKPVNIMNIFDSASDEKYHLLYVQNFYSHATLGLLSFGFRNQAASISKIVPSGDSMLLAFDEGEMPDCMVLNYNGVKVEYNNLKDNNIIVAKIN